MAASALKIMNKVLIVGSGGREHAIVWAIHNTAVAPVEILCAPGNAGIAQISQTVNISADDHAGLLSFAESNKIDLTFIGPEAPLAAGIVDFFTERGLPIVGPTAAAARLGEDHPRLPRLHARAEHRRSLRTAERRRLSLQTRGDDRHRPGDAADRIPLFAIHQRLDQ